MIEHITKKLENQQVAYEIINAGMSNEESFALSYDKKDEQSAFSLQAALNGNIKLDYIDNHMKEKVSMIKMDIEGFEYRALVGAKQTISLFQPYLAICVYHKQEDIWKIPELIYSICPRYKFYLRHYSLFPNETVLYAIIS